MRFFDQICSRMQFTPQQLTGGPKYHHKTRIGNWSEAFAVEFVQDFIETTLVVERIDQTTRWEDLMALSFGEPAELTSQDLELEEIKLKDYLKKKETTQHIPRSIQYCKYTPWTGCSRNWVPLHDLNLLNIAQQSKISFILHLSCCLSGDR